VGRDDANSARLLQCRLTSPEALRAEGYASGVSASRDDSTMSNMLGAQSKTGVVILNYNGWVDTIACVRSVLQIPETIHVIVVDNASPDQSEAKLRTWAAEEIPAINV
jgi:hypothetical protein